MKTQPTMECPSCKEIEFEHIDTLTGQGKSTLEYKCNSCGEIGYFDDPMPETIVRYESEKQLQETWHQLDNDEQAIKDFCDAG